MYRRLNEEGRRRYDQEVHKYVKEGWWKRPTRGWKSDDERPVIDVFAVETVKTGGEIKTRLVMDCRHINAGWPPCSVASGTIPDIWQG